MEMVISLSPLSTHDKDDTESKMASCITKPSYVDASSSLGNHCRYSHNEVSCNVVSHEKNAAHD